MRSAALALIACFIAAAAPAAAQTRPAPVVVELFTSQGCSACVEANAYLGEVAEREGVLPLSFSVDYWDYLGWRDTLARPEHTARQRAYLRRLNLRRLYTPQVVVDGRDAAAGFEHERIDGFIRSNTEPAWASPEITLSADARRVWIGSGRTRGAADVWLVRFDPRGRTVAVDRGENRGREVRVVNPVVAVQRLGPWRGRPLSLRLPASPDDDLRTAVLLQQPDGGPILSAAVDD